MSKQIALAFGLGWVARSGRGINDSVLVVRSNQGITIISTTFSRHLLLGNPFHGMVQAPELPLHGLDPPV
eukprot:3335093-Pyramimonas_sp.AAC.1